MSTTPRHKSNGISKECVNVLTGLGMTLTEIAKMLGVTKSYVSRVNAGQRSFTLEHLAKLQRKTGRPIPLLAMQAMSREAIAAKFLPLYDMTLNTLRELCKTPSWENTLVSVPSRPHRKRAIRTKAA